MVLKTIVVEVEGFNPQKWHNDERFVCVKVTPRGGGLPDSVEPVMGIRVRYNGKVGMKTLREVARNYVETTLGMDDVLVQPFTPEHRFWGMVSV